jgi:hypothetical protein
MSRRLLGDTPMSDAEHQQRRATRQKHCATLLQSRPSHDPEHAYDSLVAAIREMLEQVLDEVIYPVASNPCD